MIVLETERLMLREVTEDDAPFMLELLNSPGFIDGIGDRRIRTVDEARAYIHERVLSQYAQYGFGMWAVVQKSQTEPVGLAGLVKRAGLEHPDVGYAFLEQAWGKGYAREAAAAVLAHARGPLGLQTVCAIVNPHNVASKRVLETVGLRYVDTRPLEGAPAPVDYFVT